LNNHNGEVSLQGEWRLANKQTVANYNPLFFLSKYKNYLRWLAFGRPVALHQILENFG
jgi:hypothetical protein